jgi:predicted nucleic acid-binding protein
VILVVDASVAAHWLFRLSRPDEADRILDPTENRLFAPDIIVPEIANVAWKLWQFEGFDAALALETLDEIGLLFDELVPCSKLTERAFVIPMELRHSIYDCFCLALSERNGARLVSFDHRLQRRCAGTPYAALLAPVA